MLGGISCEPRRRLSVFRRIRLAVYLPFFRGKGVNFLEASSLYLTPREKRGKGAPRKKVDADMFGGGGGELPERERVLSQKR